MSVSFGDFLRRVFVTPYAPKPAELGFLARSQSQCSSGVEVTVAVPDAQESARLFGVPLFRRGLQPVHVRVANQSKVPLLLQFQSIDPRYCTPLEAAAHCHFSIIKRLSAFGLVGWFFFLPLLLLVPFKLLTAARSNRRMDALFQKLGFHRRPIVPGAVAEGFVFTPLDAGTKLVRIRLLATVALHPHGHTPDVKPELAATTQHPRLSSAAAAEAFVDLTFTVQVPGPKFDYENRHFDDIYPANATRDCDVATFEERLHEVSAVTTNHSGLGSGDPVNLVVIGEFETVLTAFTGRWDETETITLATCWKTAQSFLLGSEYRYSPVSPLFLFGRSQDIALQQIRHSISQRLHLRLWLAPLKLKGEPVWIGQVSRDIGVRFTTKVWNLTTHRIDPDVDEARDYVLEDLLDAERVEAAGYIGATAPGTPRPPGRNLTGDPYETDGKRVVILLSPHRTAARFIAWS